MTTKTKEKKEASMTSSDPTSKNPSKVLSNTPSDSKEIKVIERIFETKEIAPQDVFGKLQRSQVELIKRTVAKGASDDELRLFIQVCKGANLNPFMRQVHLVPRWDSKLGQEVRSIQVGIDGFRAVAESSGAYAGNDDPIYEGEKEVEYGSEKMGARKMTAPLKATVTVYKMLEGQRYPFTATARWDEYYPGPRMGFQWHVRPYLMLGKCAEALALRKAFPKLLSGMYAQEEMDRTVQVDAGEKRTQVGFTTLIKAIATMTLDQLADYRSKMEKSDKYTDSQKTEFIASVDARIAELKPVAEEKK